MKKKNLWVPVLGCSMFFVCDTLANVSISEFMANNRSTIENGENDNYSDWIELSNDSDQPVDIGGWYLSDDPDDLTKWMIPAGTMLDAYGFLLIWADGTNAGRHSNFKLNDRSERIILSDKNGQAVDTIVYSRQFPDISYGRDENGLDVYFSQATPGESNPQQGFSGHCLSPVMLPNGGFYQLPVGDTVNVTLELPDFSNNGINNRVIYYTLDGKKPTEGSQIYSGPINISETTVVRARIYQPGHLPSRVITRTYFINESITLPVISLSSDDEHLWGENGIMEMNNRLEFWRGPGPWKKPAAIEYYSVEGDFCFAHQGEIETHGNDSLHNAQPSLNVFAGNEYGDETINYRLFPDKDISSFKSFLLRNSGQDWAFTGFRDALSHELVKDIIDTQAYQPVVVFINGHYFGLLNMREKTNKDYLTHNYSLESKDVDFIKVRSDVVAGDTGKYDSLISFIETHDMSDDVYFDFVRSQLDVGEFMDYQITETYIDNLGDWPNNNIKFWRPRTRNGKWRWILYDTDWGFFNNKRGLHQAASVDPAWRTHTNPPWSTFLLRSLLKNITFRNRFIQRYASHISITFEHDRVLNKIDQFMGRLEPEMPRHIARWQGETGRSIMSSVTVWRNSIESMFSGHLRYPGMKFFNSRRHKGARRNLIEFFDLLGRGFYNPGEIDANIEEAMFSLSIKMDTLESGTIAVAGVRVLDEVYQVNQQSQEYMYSGLHFKNLPIELSAYPAAGYRFVGWKNSDGSMLEEPVFSATDDVTLQAVFEPSTFSNEDLIVSEIMFHPSEATANTVAGVEFLELKNIGDTTVDLAGYRFTDGISFTFTEGTVLLPGAVVVITRDLKLFRKNYGIVPVAGEYSGKLRNEGELLTLLDDNSNVVFNFAYALTESWPAQARTGGLSLETISYDHQFDHADYRNWRASTIQGGTPGVSVDRLSTSRNYNEFVENQWNGSQTNTAPDEDFDQDGVSNLAEYLLGQDPNARGDRPNVEISALTVDENESPIDGFAISFNIPLFDKHVSYYIEWAPFESPSHMHRWTVIDESATQTFDNILGGKRIITIKEPAEDSGRFYRLRASVEE